MLDHEARSQSLKSGFVRSDHGGSTRLTMPVFFATEQLYYSKNVLGNEAL